MADGLHNQCAACIKASREARLSEGLPKNKKGNPIGKRSLTRALALQIRELQAIVTAMTAETSALLKELQARPQPRNAERAGAFQLEY
jgi:hypothetical protein